MACTEDEFIELLEGESFLDIDKLREMSNYGIPDAVRGDVWLYLLGVSKADKCTCFSEFLCLLC
jgi:hypothetical protein